jgi:hypothetical protein
MRGDSGPGVAVKVIAGEGRLRLVSGNELVGDWSVSHIGVNALQDGFAIKAEGEEFVLRTQDDVAFATELGVTAVSPRLGRRLAASTNPEEPDASTETRDDSANLAAIGFALAGALIVLGGTFLDAVDTGSDYRLAFVIGGVLMIAMAYVMSIGARLARVIAAVLLIAMVVVFGLSIQQSAPATTQLTAFGFIAGGLVVGVAVLVSGSLSQPD